VTPPRHIQSLWATSGTSFAAVGGPDFYHNLIRKYKDMTCGGKFDSETGLHKAVSNKVYGDNDKIIIDPHAPLYPPYDPNGTETDQRGQTHNPVRHGWLAGSVIGDVRLEDDMKYEGTLLPQALGERARADGRALKPIPRQALHLSRNTWGTVSSPLGVVLTKGGGAVNYNDNWFKANPRDGLECVLAIAIGNLVSPELSQTDADGVHKKEVIIPKEFKIMEPNCKDPELQPLCWTTNSVSEQQLHRGVWDEENLHLKTSETPGADPGD